MLCCQQTHFSTQHAHSTWSHREGEYSSSLLSTFASRRRPDEMIQRQISNISEPKTCIFKKNYLELRSFISTIETTLLSQSAQYNNLWINIYCACVRLIYVHNELYFKFFSFILLRAWCIDYHVHKKQCLRARCTEKIPFVHTVSFTCPLVLNVRQVSILSVFIIHMVSSPPIWFVQ